MLEYYGQVKAVHMGAVFTSGGLFLLRGLLSQADESRALARLAGSTPVRYLAYGIDTVLLTAALMLATMLPAAMFANGWLLAKLLLLPAYVVLGVFALRRGRSAGVRRASLVAAMAVFLCMLAIARTHDPLGPLALLRTI